MIIYRLSIEPYKDDLTGEGAKLFGGRWNPAGKAAIYATENISLAVLEILVRTDIRFIPPAYYLIKIEIPENIIPANIRRSKLKSNWKNDVEYTRGMGHDFLQSANSLVLKIPSAIIDEEHNFIINPAHSDSKKIKTTASKFQFDKRLFLANA